MYRVERAVGERGAGIASQRCARVAGIAGRFELRGDERRV